MSSNESKFYNQQDVAGGIMMYYNNATPEDFNKKCADFCIDGLTWRCFGKDCVFFYKNHDYEDSEDEDEEDEE